MEQSDIDLLQTVPMYHLQALVKARRVPIVLGQDLTASVSLSDEVLEEIAHSLFEDIALYKIVRDLDGVERAILYELAACGGRANSRDLALYLTYADVLAPSKKTSATQEQETTSSMGDAPLVRPIQQQTSLAHRISLTPSTAPAPLHVPQYPVPHPHGTFEQALRHLLFLGLLFWGKQTNFAGRDYTNGIHDGVIILPKAVREVVQAVWGFPIAFPIANKEENTSDNDGQQADGVMHDGGDIGEGARQLQRTLYLYWSLVASLREGLTVLGSGLLTRASLRQIIEHIGPSSHSGQVRAESDVPRLLFMRLLLMKLGLLQERPNGIHAAPALIFFSLPVLERARRCYRLWLETPFWDELLFLPDVTVRPGANPGSEANEEVVRARASVVERLSYETVGVWHPLAATIARAKLYKPYLLFPRQYGNRTERYSASSNPYGWDFRLRRGWLTPREGWHMVEGGFIRALIGGPLSWLGLVDMNAEDMATSFCIVPGATLVMSDEPITQQETTWGRLIVQPNFELIVLAPVSEALLVNLDRFAERVSLELIAQYRLTKASVTRAIQMGMHAEDIQRLLEGATEGELPQNICYSLVEWERQARRVEMWQHATLLEVDDPTLLDTVFADEEARPMLRRRITPLLAEVATRHLPRLQELLWRQKQLPSLTSAPTQDTMVENGRLLVREPQWRLQEDGMLCPLYAVLDLYMVAELTQFSELDEASGWHKITPISLRKAIEKGKTLEQIIAFLQRYCERGIPTSFLIRLKLWGGGYNEQQSIHVEQMPLLRLHASILQDIQVDEELSPLLGSEVEQKSRLIRVDAQHLDRVIALLRERGFLVK